MDEAAFSGIVDFIYDAAAAPALWPDALDHLGRAFGASVVSLIDRDFHTSAGRATAWGIDEGSQREFIDVWGTRNVFVQRTRRWQPGQIETDREILPKAELLASDYYNGFMKPHDMHALMRLTLDVGTGVNAGYNQILSLARSLAAGEYETEDIERCRHFVPHLLRASRIARQLEQAHVMLDGLTGLLELNPAGIAILDSAGKIAFANRAIRTMAATADGIVLRQGRIAALDRHDDAALQSLIGRATLPAPRADMARGGGVRLMRESGMPAFNVIIAPLARTASWKATGPAAFVLVTDPGAMPMPAEEILAQLFGFTPAEVRVAQRLMLGETPEQTAAALDIGISTARWHLGALYRKTGTSRQAELVRFLLCLPAMGAP